MPKDYICPIEGCKKLIKNGLWNYAKHIEEHHITYVTMKPLTFADLEEIIKQMSNK